MTSLASILTAIDAMRDTLDTARNALDAMRIEVVALSAADAPVEGGLIPPRLIPVKAATALVKRDVYTLKRWCKHHGLGQKIAGQWHVDVELLKQFVQNGCVNTLHG